MKARFLAVAVLATIAISSAVDEECVQRRLRGLPIHWPNPTSCTSFYRCTNKNVKRELVCPTAKEYNPKTGRCVSIGRKLCKLSLKSALDETTSPCANELSGTYVADDKSCRGFNICNNKLAYPQSCDAGSYFNTSAAACVPDTKLTCWENLCMSRDNGVYLPNDNDCYHFYICSNQVPVAQECPKGSYFDKDTLNCRPGVCPSDITTPPTTETTTPRPEETTTPEITTPCPEETTTRKITTPCPEETTTPKITTPSTNETTTPEITTPCEEETTTPEITTPCEDETTTAVEGDCAETNCDQTKCLNAADDTIFGALSGISMFCKCLNQRAVCQECVGDSVFFPEFKICLDTTTPPPTTVPVGDSTTPCIEDTTTAKTTTPCEDETTTAVEGDCAKTNCDQTKCLNAADDTIFGALSGISMYCKCLNQKAVCQECVGDSVFFPEFKICLDTTTPPPTTVPVEDSTTPCIEDTTTAKTTTPCEDETTTAVESDCAKTNCDQTKCLNAADDTIFGALSGISMYCKCLNQKAVCQECVGDSVFFPEFKICLDTTTPPPTTVPVEDSTTPCIEDTTTAKTTTPCEDETTTAVESDCAKTNCDQTKCLNAADDTIFGALSGISMYCKCLNQKAVCQECVGDSVFFPEFKICLDTTTPPPTTVPVEDSTTPCIEDTTTAKTTTPCEDETTTAVESDCAKTNCDQTKCLNAADDTIFGALSGISMYCKCLNQKAVCQECVGDSVFFPEFKICLDTTTPPPTTVPVEDSTTPCIEDTTTAKTTTPCEDETTTAVESDCAKTNCDQTKCLNAADDTIFGALSGISMYCKCLNQKAVCQECVGDSVFFPEFKICLDTTTPPPTTVPVEDSTTPCVEDTTTAKTTTPCEDETTTEAPSGTPKPITCVGGLEEGEFAPNLENCMLFYICFDGELINSSCGTGNYFDVEKMNCVTDTDGKCPQCTNAQPSKRRRKRSVVQPPSDTEPCCPGGYKNGEMIPHPTDCNRMLVCCDGEMKEESCDKGYYFNAKTSKCEPDTGNVCKPSSTLCSDGEVMQNPANCSSYLACCTGAFVEKFCDVDYYFSKVSMKCEPDTEHVCWPDNSCTCPGGYRQGEVLPSTDCDKFYICNDGDLVLQDCGVNNYFNPKTKTCELDTKYECWKNYCADQPNGALVANPNQCNAFYHCERGKQTDGVCASGEWFDPKESSCQPDVNAECYNPCATEDKITVFPNPDCNKFYWCNGKHTQVGTCAVGGFDETLGACNPKKSCSANNCFGEPNYYTYPDPDNATKFYVCMSGVPVMRECPSGTEFHGQVCVHVSDRDCDATPCLSSGYVPPYATLNATEDNAFCMCRDGFATKQYCSPEYVFNSEHGACYSNAPCDPNVCKYSDDYFAFVNRNDTNSFCLCVDSTAVIVQCPSGSFNPYISSCTDVEISEQCDQAVCRNQNNYYTYPDKTNSVNGFCKCETKVGVFIDCPENTVYDSTYGVCKLNNINCDSSKCKGQPDYTQLPALTTSDGYCECLDGKATYYNYPSPCDVITCDAGDEDKAFPANNTNTGFCLCVGNKAEYHDCEVGGVFNTAMGLCMMPLKNCDDTMCAGQPDNTKQPAWSTLNGYCLCSGGKATFEDCVNGQVFDKDTQACVRENLPIQDRCDVSYCKDPANAGAKYPSFSNAYGYCECAPTGPAFNYCPDGDIFHSTSLTCTPSAASQCNLALCAGANPDNTFATPAKNLTTSFCFCSGPNSVMLLNCPPDKFYSNEQQLCVSAINEGCTCPNGLQNGNRIPDTSDCSQYYVCNAGSMHQQSCPSGQYFNVDCNDCIEDDGTCVPKAACTCLGAYREGERMEHPLNNRMFYVCENKMLHERDCGTGRIFNKQINQCMIQRTTGGHYLRKRSVDVDEFVCVNDEKRSVPSNCSQYEVCINETWKRRTCTQFRYYNPEQQKCLEPRDDTICAYAKVTMLPECSTELEQRVHKGRTCQQYFRCQKGKWRLKSCGKTQYYEERLAACLPHGLDDAFECNRLGGASTESTTASQRQCQHLSVRPYDKNCAMYLMCLENHWWYQYCPLGMYFNRSLNYCTPDPENYCLEAIIRTPSNVSAEDYIVKEPCSPEGVLRPSALACNRYYICIGGQWQHQQCANQDFYDVEHNKCSPDTGGICAQLHLDCSPREKRVFPLNCSAYEECSSTGKWYRSDCPQSEIFDELLQRCVPNDGICSARGLKRVCSERETRPVAVNCTQFYFCEKDNWALGTCLRGHMFSPKLSKCVPHSVGDKCQPLKEEETQKTHLGQVANQTNFCENQLDGTAVAHPSDCSRYYICIQESLSHELQCSVGSFYDSSLGYCRPNDGSCRLELTGVCANATDETLVAHPTDCQAYYSCSTITGQQLMHCPVGQYYHIYTRQCRVDHGECKGSNNNFGNDAKCQNVTHGSLLAHELYCNIYYACVKGLAIPVECPDNYKFNALLGKCIYDADNQCQDGQLVEGNQTYSCGNLTDGSYIADRKDCTRYYICSAGQAQPKKCADRTYFDSHQLLCVPDDGSCPYVDDNESNETPMPPDPIVCEGKHGNLMPDPLNCNNFYVCINSKLRHERCYAQHFFNASSNQCQQKLTYSDNNQTVASMVVEEEAVMPLTAQRQQCTDEPITVKQLCQEFADGATIADQGDCRLYITCQEEENPISQRCRNGESYDGLLGFCRQNDGTCLLENGQRAGECSDHHGQLVRDTNNCRQYFVCVNGQKIAQTCRDHEYFSKTQSMCVDDTLNICQPEQQSEEPTKQSCVGLSESVLYPYIYDNCRSYFQCIKGVARVHQCADDLYFDPNAIKCVRNLTECVLPQQTMQRTTVIKKQTYDQLCSDRKLDQMYANVENHCRSFYTCGRNGEVIHELCPLGMAFDHMENSCVTENKVICV